jgi:hypothetical protein
MMFRVVATVVHDVNGWRRMVQVPMFFLDGNVQGLMSEAQAEGFATQMLADLANVPVENVSVSVCLD